MKVLRNALIAASACLFAASAVAQEGLVDEIRQPTLKALEGKKVVFVPMSMSFDLPEGWAAVMQKEAGRLGYHLDIRDANWSTDTGTRAITQAITEKPDIILVQNFDVTSYARLLKRAEEAGIKVVQVNMKSSYQTDAFVGADWYGIGQYAANRMIEKCGTKAGKSGKIAINRGCQRLSAECHLGYAEGSRRYQSRLQSDGRLGSIQSQSHHSNGDPAKSGSVRDYRVLGRDGCRYRRGDRRVGKEHLFDHVRRR
jgi:ABC-type sugar transport system substrate-binding protein